MCTGQHGKGVDEQRGLKRNIAAEEVHDVVEGHALGTQPECDAVMLAKVAAELEATHARICCS